MGLKTPAKVNMDVQAEILDLKRRVTALENEVQSNHDFSVKIFTYVREVRDDIALLREHAVATGKRVEHMDLRLDQLERRMDKLDQRVGRMEQRLERVENDVAALRSEFNVFRKELPGMIADTMREVLRDYRSR